MEKLDLVIARAFLRIGYTVVPVTREMDMEQVSLDIQEPEAVVIAVGEADLHTILNKVPSTWKSKLILIQNELLPRDWEMYDTQNRSVISVLFLKKSGR